MLIIIFVSPNVLYLTRNCATKLIGMELIPLTRGQYAQVDDEDFQWLNSFNWSISESSKKHRTFYAARKLSIKLGEAEKGSVKIIRLHVFIYQRYFPGYTGEIDHIDNNGLNCQKHNMRKASRLQNTHNTRGNQGRLLPKGVTRHGNKFRAYICANGKGRYLGLHKTIMEAAKAYDIAAIKLFNEYASLNKL